MSIGSFSGLASGIQWRDLLDQVMRAESARRITPVKQEATVEQRRIDGLNRYRDLAGKLNTAAKALGDGTAFGKFAVSVPPSPVTGRTLLAASASSEAAAGSYDVEVLSLARVHNMASGGKTSDTTALNLPADSLSGTATFALNGKTITVDGSDSLASIRDKINAADAGVTAGVLKESAGSFRLTLTSSTPGAEGIAYQDGPEGAGAALGISTTQAGSDAQLRINGITVTRQTNTVSDAIAGVTLELQQAEVGTTLRLGVTRDDGAALDTIKAFVTAYNDIRAFVDAQVSSATQPLTRSSVLRQSISAFKGALLEDVPDPSTTTLPRLGSLGITLSRSGTLEIDEARLKDALAKTPTDAKALLASVGSRIGVAAEALVRAETGGIAAQVKIHDRSIVTLNKRVEGIQDRLDRQYERMVKDYVRMEEALGRIQSQGNWLASQIGSMQPQKR